MREFREALDDCSLTDLGFVDWWFTWERGGFVFTNIRERLDRGVATLSWVNLFPGYRLEHLIHSFFDHYPLLLDTMGVVWNNQDSLVKPFRFEGKWCLDSSFEGMVKRWWDDNFGSVLGKLEELGNHLLKWSKSTAEITKVQLGLNLEGNKEELFWEQRARVNWLKNGDQNTSFFHKVALQRHFYGRITELQDENGG
ncbi:uncharacterized protein [Gossypium hirsutum]|uniref:Reverse transcriptase n=1 Tax=Gossypium hirsutum TaxID=3635 RepID=A0A1U8PAU0_GOSHI|nr:uncharacterized protein LOC107956128 [Gossypium hirsutum]